MSDRQGSTFYVFCRALAWLIFRLFCRVHSVVLEPPPRQGAFIVASNHISHFDPPFLSAFFPRDLDWVTMEELFRYSWSARFFSWLNAISIDRFSNNPNANRQALHKMMARLSQGRAIGIFPEGGIRTGTTSILEGAPLKPGASTLSILSQAPIIPCVVLGTDRLYCTKNWLHRPQLYIIIGRAAIPPKTDISNREEARCRFQEQLSATFPELQKILCQRFQLHHDDLPKTPQERRLQIV